MIVARAGSGWQYALADLSLILFLVAASAVEAPGASPTARPPERSSPVAVYRSAAGAPSLRAWLRAQPADPRQQLTIVAPYGPADLSATVALAEGLAHEAALAGHRARIVIEPGSGPISATLAYDPALARSLQQGAATASR